MIISFFFFKKISIEYMTKYENKYSFSVSIELAA